MRPHDLLIAKPDSCCLDKPGLNLVNVYLHFCKQRKKLALRVVTELILPGVFPRDSF